jgi:2-polyprenyl-6-methoxyphenol hydroxylase-like FAD-dependent oxidoreductase
MSASTSPAAPCLIVGAGPVGLLTALLLAREGVRSLVIERHQSRLGAPKAHAVNPRTLEICRAAGIEWERFRAKAPPADEGHYVRFVTRLAGEELGVLTYERQDDAVLDLTPTPLLNIPQPDFEEILLDELTDYPEVEIRRGHEWRNSREEDGCVSSTVADRESGEAYEIESRYVVAADGAGSRIRESLGIEMEGVPNVGSAVMIHFGADLSPLVGSRPAVLYWALDPDVLGTFIAYDIRSTWVLMHLAGERTPAEPTAEWAQQEVLHAIGDDSVDVEIKDISPWRTGAQVAARYCAGKIFLAGDAAHRFPPTGGLGLNTGAADAHNLAWKIAACEKGWATDRLLDTYQEERKPVAQDNARQSMMNTFQLGSFVNFVTSTHGSLASSEGRETISARISEMHDHFDSLRLQLGYVYGDPEHDSVRSVGDFVPTAHVGARLPHAWVERDGARVSTLDLLDPSGFTLLVGGTDSWQSLPDVHGAPIRCLRLGSDFVDPDGICLKTLELEADSALLIRPDGHILARAEHDLPREADEMQSALDVLLLQP